MFRPPTRSCCRFRLRTAFLIWTLLALWLGWENYIVFRRRTIAERLVDERRGHHTEYAADGAGTFRGPGGSNLFTWKGDSSVTARSLQFMLGSSNVFVPRSTGPS